MTSIKSGIKYWKREHGLLKHDILRKKLIIAFFGDSLTDGTPGVSYIDILKNKVPSHTLLNYGKKGDTVISLHQRIQKAQVIPRFDLAFLWVGVNDVLARKTWGQRLIKRLRNQPPARSYQEFSSTYRSLLDILREQAGRLATVPPLFIGEDIDNIWNRELDKLDKIIQDLSAAASYVYYLNLRDVLLPALRPDSALHFVPRTFLSSLPGILGLKSRLQDKKSASTGGIFTIDGIHLNKTGAERVADIFAEAILNVDRYFPCRNRFPG